VEKHRILFLHTWFALLAGCLMLVSCLAYYSTMKMYATCSSKTSVDFTRLYGIVFQKTELFIDITVRPSYISTFHHLLTQLYLQVLEQWCTILGPQPQHKSESLWRVKKSAEAGTFLFVTTCRPVCSVPSPISNE
jgi:hypothetical protein